LIRPAFQSISCFSNPEPFRDEFTEILMKLRELFKPRFNPTFSLTASKPSPTIYESSTNIKGRTGELKLSPLNFNIRH